MLQLPIPAGEALLNELVALSRAQRSTLRAVHRLVEDVPLMALLLTSRVAYRRANAHRTKSGKRIEELVVATFYKAQAVGFRGDLNDWRKLLAMFPRP